MMDIWTRMSLPSSSIASISIPLCKTLSRTFKHEYHLHGKNITYRQCMDLLTLYTQGKLGDHASAQAQYSMGLVLWKSTFGENEDYVSASAFLTFLKETQHEEDATLADVQALVFLAQFHGTQSR